MVTGLRHENAVSMKRPIAVVAALAMVLAACASSRAAIKDEFTGPNVTTTTSAPFPSQVTTTTLPLPVEDEIITLMGTVEELRELSFDSLPAIERRSDATVQAEYRRVHSYSGATNSLHQDGFLEMLGVLEPGQIISDLEVIAPVPGVYDPASGAILISQDLRELTPFGRLVLVGELVAAVTDQEFGWSARMAQLEASAEAEAAQSIRALVNGDATFISDLYEERFMTATERFAVGLEALEQEQGLERLPGYVKEFHAFNTQHARDFVVDLVSEGGIGELNRAYSEPPTTSEQVYHTFRYFDEEPARSVELPAPSVTGFEEVESGTFGEWGLRALLSEGVSSARQLEAATGWGGDGYRVWWDGEHAVMLLLFEGDAGRDAASLAETLGRWAIEQLPVGGGLTDNTGLAFEGLNSYAFVAQAGTEVLLVVGSDPTAAKRLRDRFWPEY